MRFVSAHLPTKYGDFIIKGWKAPRGQEPFAIVTLNLDVTKPVLVRVHSECVTGDAMHSFKCDCGQQKDMALKMISKSKNGLLIYLRQEGRGIGLYEKIRAYKLQEEGLDTHEANIALGHKPDQRDYGWVKTILEDLGVTDIRLITNNPSKISEIAAMGFSIVERVPLIIPQNKYNRRYFETKKHKFKHFFGKHESAYFFGLSYIDSPGQIEAIGEFMREKKRDPHLKICLGVFGDHDLLADESYIKKTEAIFRAAEYYRGFVPILHFTFSKSKNYLADLKLIKRKMPFVNYIQLNDFDHFSMKAFGYACKNFLVDFPLSDSNFDLIKRKPFRKLVIAHKVFIPIDNSKGRGRQDSVENYYSKIQNLLDYGISDIALAGGFGPGTLLNYFTVRDYFKISFSVQAESRLYKDGKLNLTRVKKYLLELLNHRKIIE